MRKEQYQKAIKNVIPLFSEDSHGVFWSSYFKDLIYDPTLLGREKYWVLRKYGSYISNKINNLLTLAFRIDAFRIEICKINEPTYNLYYRYIEIDIEHCFSEMRTLFDYWAKIFLILNDLVGRAPESFRKLVPWYFDNKTRLSFDFSELLADCDWFSEIRSIRDDLIHFGGKALAFPPQADCILFQVYKDGSIQKILTSEFMFNKNVAIFERVFSAYFSLVLSFLEESGKLFFQKENLSLKEHRVRSYSFGFPLLKKWAQDLINAEETG